MRKRNFVVLIIGILVFTGCGGKDTDRSLEDPFIGGNTGVLLSFAEDAPTAEVYAGGNNPFDAVVKLKYDREYSIKKKIK